MAHYKCELCEQVLETEYYDGETFMRYCQTCRTKRVFYRVE